MLPGNRAPDSTGKKKNKISLRFQEVTAGSLEVSTRLVFKVRGAGQGAAEGRQQGAYRLSDDGSFTDQYSLQHSAIFIVIVHFIHCKG